MGLALHARVVVLRACAGLHAMLAYLVSTRTRAVAVRHALGAFARSILQMVVSQGALQVVIGLVLGGLLGFGIGKALSFMLYNVDSFDPDTLFTVAIVLGASAMQAIWLPSRLAMAVEPMRALRDG